MAVIWEKSQQAFLTLWDIDREFQNAHEAYEQWQARNRRKRSAWACFGVKNQDDALGKALNLGREVRRVMETGKELYGSRFEQGDSTSKDHSVYDLSTNYRQRHVTRSFQHNFFACNTRSGNLSTTLRCTLYASHYLMMISSRQPKASDAHASSP
jgi:hypothetical protein